MFQSITVILVCGSTFPMIWSPSSLSSYSYTAANLHCPVPYTTSPSNRSGAEKAVSGPELRFHIATYYL